MTISDLYPPIALSTFVSFVSFYLFWRMSKVETETGEAPLWGVLFGLIYIGSLLTFLYFYGDSTLQSFLELFAAGMIGNAFGALLIFLLSGLLSHRRSVAAGVWTVLLFVAAPITIPRAYFAEVRSGAKTIRQALIGILILSPLWGVGVLMPFFAIGRMIGFW